MLRRLTLVLIAIAFACGFPLHVTFGHTAHAVHVSAEASEHAHGAPCPDHSGTKGITPAYCDLACSVAVTMPAAPQLVAASVRYGVEFPPSPQKGGKAADPAVEPFPPRQLIRS